MASTAGTSAFPTSPSSKPVFGRPAGGHGNGIGTSPPFSREWAPPPCSASLSATGIARARASCRCGGSCLTSSTCGATSAYSTSAAAEAPSSSRRPTGCHTAARPVLTSGGCVIRPGTAGPPPSAMRGSRASVTASSSSRPTLGICRLRRTHTTSWSATSPSPTSAARKNAPGRCAKLSECFAPVGGCASLMTPVQAGTLTSFGLPGCSDIEVRRLDWRTWFGLPGHHLVLVAASKPAADTR